MITSNEKAMGGSGVVFCKNGTNFSGRGICVQILAEAVVSSVTAAENYSISGVTSAAAIPVGVYPWRITALALTSGEALVYTA